MQWDRILADAERAQALAPDAAAAFLTTLETTTDHAGEVRSLLTRLSAGFLATSADEWAENVELVGGEGKRIGPWRLEALLGRGGMGEVWRARRDDGLYDQNAAVKLMQPGGPERAARFDNERRRLAQMEHPGIARILDGGITGEGVAYMAMDLVDGQPIDQYAAKLSSREQVRLIADACDAVHHAHTKLILHRDLKPANILVDRQGQVRLIDFGIASSLAEDEAGGPLTLAYAAPEQLRGAPLSVATDVFALGLVMHTVLTGRVPRRLADASPATEIRTAGSADLTAIILKATRADAVFRYPSAEALAADLRRYLDGQAVKARDGGPAYRFGKFLGRYPIASSATALAVLALVGGLAASLSFANISHSAERRASEALAQAEWQLKRTATFYHAQVAYGDALQRLFGAGSDAETLGNALRNIWQEAYDKRESNPDTAAALSYAIGRNFYFRGDNVSALSIFDVWMHEGYGSPELIATGEEVYALMLMDAGRTDEAIPRMRALVSHFDTGFATSLSDQVNYAVRLARLTGDESDVALAEYLLQQRMSQDLPPFDRLFGFSQLAVLRMLRDDQEGALQAYRDTLRMLDLHPEYAASGRDITRFNLASVYLFHRGDTIEATRLADLILTEDVELKGESLQTGRGFLIRGLAAEAEGRTEDALRDIESAHQIFLNFAGPSSPHSISALSARAVTYAANGQAEEAAVAIAEAKILIEEDTDSIEFPIVLRVADLLVRQLAGADSGAIGQAALSESELDGLRRDPVSRYYFDRLIAARAARANGTD